MHTDTIIYPYFNRTLLDTRSMTNKAVTCITIGCNGIICEILIYNYVLSDANRQTIEGYLANKWLSKNKLPVDHPYYSPT